MTDVVAVEIEAEEDTSTEELLDLLPLTMAIVIIGILLSVSIIILGFLLRKRPIQMQKVSSKQIKETERKEKPDSTIKNTKSR